MQFVETRGELGRVLPVDQVLDQLVLVHHLVVHHRLDQPTAAQQFLDLGQRLLRLVGFHRLLRLGRRRRASMRLHGIGLAGVGHGEAGAKKCGNFRR